MTTTPEMTHVWIQHVRRLNNSRNGNPRFDVTFTDGDLGSWTYRTSADASCNYDIENLLRSHDLVDVYLNRRDLIVDLRPSATDVPTGLL